MFDGAIDDGERLQALPSRVVVDWNLVLRETAGRRAVEQPARSDSLPESPLDGNAVQHRLQRRSAADDEIGIRSVFAGLVIGDPQHVEVGPMLDEIDRAAEDEASVDGHRIRQAAGVATLGHIERSRRPAGAQAEAELEVFRTPRAAIGELLHPDAKVAPYLVDLVAPDPIDGRRELLRVVGRHAIQDCIERLDRVRQPIHRDRQRLFRFHRAVELRLRAMEQTAARERIHAHEWLRLVPRLEAIDGREQKLVRTTGEALQRRQRVRPPTQPLTLERSADPRRDLDQSIARRPRGSAAGPAADDRSSERVIEAQQVVRVPLDRPGISAVEQRLQDGEIVLEVVDGAIGILRRGPREARARFFGGLGRQDAMIGNAAGDGAHDVERVKRRDSGARFGDVEPGIRQVQPFPGRADRDLQQQPFGASTRVLADERRIERAAASV